MPALAVARSAQPDPNPQPETYSRWRLTLGILGRSWLWFLAGCLLVTLVPIVFGWRPFLIESGSMEPRISIGDVVLSAPTELSDQGLVGHIIVFQDPDVPSRTKTHRVVGLAADGPALITKGDANRTNDSMHVPRENVHGLGRLLVRYVGLPVIWAHDGQWAYFLLFVLTVLGAAWAVNRDREEGLEPDGSGGEGGSGEPPAPTPLPTRPETPTAIAATRPLGLSRETVHALAFRTAVLGGMCLALLLPTTAAAFAATTRNTANTWSVPNWSYSSEVINLDPYLYWKLDETGTTTVAADSSGHNRAGQYNNTGATNRFTRLGDGALLTDTPDRAVKLVNANSCINTASTDLFQGQTPVTVVIWFMAAANYNQGGKLAGFEKPRTGVAVPSTGTYDRHLYMDGNGKIWFGVYNGGFVTVGSTAADLADDAWHMAVGSVGPAGTKLYIDGVLQGTNANTQGEATDGVWRAGCGNLGGWGGSWGGTNSPTTNSDPTQNRTFLGSLDEFSVFTTQLTDAQVAFLYWTR